MGGNTCLIIALLRFSYKVTCQRRPENNVVDTLDYKVKGTGKMINLLNLESCHNPFDVLGILLLYFLKNFFGLILIYVLCVYFSGEG